MRFEVYEIYETSEIYDDLRYMHIYIYACTYIYI